MKHIEYKRVDSNEELHQILELQRVNIPSSISETEKKQEGFVTVYHDFEILKAMNNKCPHIIAKSNNNVVGYALCMLREFREDIEVLRSMFQQIDSCLRPDETYIVMGQICIDKDFRKQSVFRGMYTFMKQQMQPHFDQIITEVDIKNTRSLNAHYAIGFKILHTYHSNNQDWEIIFWNWS